MPPFKGNNKNIQNKAKKDMRVTDEDSGSANE